MGPLLKEVGFLVTVDTGRAELPQPLCLVKGFKGEEKDQRWMRVESGTTCENSTHTRLCVPIGHCAEIWLMSLQCHSLSSLKDHRCWERFPNTREGQLIVPTFKKGKRDDPKNYRPARLTLILGKIMV